MKYNYYVREINTNVYKKVSGCNKFDLYLSILKKGIDPSHCVLLTMDKKKEMWYNEFFLNAEYYINRYFDHIRFIKPKTFIFI